MRALLTSLIVLLFTASASADEAQDKITLLLRERSLVDFLIGQRIVADKIPLETWRNGNADKDAWGPATPQPLFSTGGTLYIINLWGTWCDPCEKELPLLSDVWTRLQEDTALKASVRLIFVAVAGNSAEKIRERQKSFKQMGTEVPLFGDGASALPQSLGDQTALGEPSYPTTLLVDRCGVIRHAFVGPLIGRRAAFDTAIRRLATATAGLTCTGDPLKEAAQTGKGNGSSIPRGKKTERAQTDGTTQPLKKGSADAGKQGKSTPPQGKKTDLAKASTAPQQPKKGSADAGKQGKNPLPPQGKKTDLAKAGTTSPQPKKGSADAEQAGQGTLPPRNKRRDMARVDSVPQAKKGKQAQ